MYAIQNIKTGKFVYGTDYRYPKPTRNGIKEQATIRCLHMQTMNQQKVISEEEVVARITE
jgi:hypothetical protein